MKLNVEEILMVIIAFIIGWFLSNMMNRGFFGRRPVRLESTLRFRSQATGAVIK